MKRKEIKSSNISSIGYDKKSQILEVEFSNGSIYQYWPVEEKRYKNLIEAESPGKLFAKNIRNDSDLNYSKVTNDNSDI